MLAREDLLWCKATVVSQQALSQRFLSFPAALFEQVFLDLLPQFKQRWAQRQRRPLPASVQCAHKQFDLLWIADSSTLEALFLKLKSWQDKATGTRFREDGYGNGFSYQATCTDLVWAKSNALVILVHEDDLLNIVAANTWLIIDRGFYHFLFWSQLQSKGVDIICRLKAGAAYTIERTFTHRAQVRDQLIRLGVKRKGAPQLQMRLVQVKFGSVWYSYVTTVVEPERLPPYVVADLYRRRWRIEEAFNTVKRLLGLSYLWTGSINGVQLQIWATWLFYAVLVDLGDAVADEVGVPFDSISLEMLYRGMYHFGVAYDKGKASDPVSYFSAPENLDLRVVKIRKKEAPLDLSPFPRPRLTFSPSS